jgi:hypothetical protein
MATGIEKNEVINMEEAQNRAKRTELNEIELERASYLNNLDELVFESQAGFW